MKAFLMEDPSDMETIRKWAQLAQDKESSKSEGSKWIHDLIEYCHAVYDMIDHTSEE